MKKCIFAAVLAACAVPGTAPAATVPSPPPGTVLDCGFIQINPYVQIANLTTRYQATQAMCRVAYDVAPKIFRASVRHNMHSFRWGAWWVSVRTGRVSDGQGGQIVYYDERATASHGRVVRFQVYSE